MGAGRPNAREAAFRRFSPCGRRHAGGFGKGSVFLEHAGDFLRIVRLRQSELEKETGLLGIERAAFNEAGLVVLLHVRADHARSPCGRRAPRRCPSGRLRQARARSGRERNHCRNRRARCPWHPRRWRRRQGRGRRWRACRGCRRAAACQASSIEFALVRVTHGGVAQEVVLAVRRCSRGSPGRRLECGDVRRTWTS